MFLFNLSSVVAKTSQQGARPQEERPRLVTNCTVTLKVLASRSELKEKGSGAVSRPWSAWKTGERMRKQLHQTPTLLSWDVPYVIRQKEEKKTQRRKQSCRDQNRLLGPVQGPHRAQP